MGIALLCAVLFSQQPAPETVASVEIRLAAQADPSLLDRVASLIFVRKGQPFSRRNLQRSLEALYASGRFSSVEVLSQHSDLGEVIVFRVEPQAKIERLSIEGTSPIDGATLLAEVGIKEGADGAREEQQAAAEALTEALRRRGFESATVNAQSEVSESGNVNLVFVCSLQQPTLVSEVVFEGQPALPTEVLQEALGFKLGDRYDLSRAAAGVERLKLLYRKGKYFRAKVQNVLKETGGRLVIPVNAGPLFNVTFQGNRRFSDEALLKVLAYAGEETLDEGVVRRLVSRIERVYRFAGFGNVKVRGQQRANTELGQLIFSIEEGNPFSRVMATFEGNVSVRSDVMREILIRTVESNAPTLSSEVHGSEDPLRIEGSHKSAFAEDVPSSLTAFVFDPESWREAASKMVTEYRSRGYLSASVRLKEVVSQNESVEGRFEVIEGLQTRIRSLRVTGLPDSLVSVAKDLVAPDEILAAGKMDDVKEQVVSRLTRKGHLYAKAKPSFAIDSVTGKADCLIEVEPGPMVTTRRILVVGNVYTKDDIVTSQVTLEEGAPLSSESLADSQNNLLASGLYRTAQVELLSPEVAEPLKTVVVKVTERPRFTYELGLGYFLADGPRLVADLLAPNLGGRAVAVNGHLQLNFFALSTPALTRQVDVADLTALEQLGGRGNVSLQNRGLLPAHIGVRLDLVGERVFRPQFRFTRFAAVPTLDWSTGFPFPLFAFAKPKLTLQLQYEAEWSSVLRTAANFQQEGVLNVIDQARLRFLFGVFALQTGRLTATIDMRDNALVPKKGLLLQGTGELTGALDARDERDTAVQVEFTKLSGLLTGYVPLSSSVLALSARAGRIFALRSGSVTPPVKRFFLGGATSMRGFLEDQLLAADLRAQYQREVSSCGALASQAGCTPAANAIGRNQQVPSQGGELFVVLKSELRFPVRAFDLALFFELGNLWLSTPQNGVPLRSSAGIGARYVTPVGPLAFDVGFNLSPDNALKEPIAVLHFNIGVF